MIFQVESMLMRDVETLPCFMVNNLTRNTEEQCKFIVDNDCLESEATIDYVYLVFCDISHERRWAAIVLILSLVIVMFLNLSAVADEFLCPNLLTVAKHLRMSDSLAGVTLLAFGNGCPDIFSSLAAASSGRPEIIVGELLGAGIFCTSIVAGLIFIHSDFKLARRPLLRDATFYLLAVFLMWLFCFQGQVTFYGSLAFIIIYVIYLFFALSGQAIHSRMRGDYPIAEEIARQDDEKTNGRLSNEKTSTQQEDLEHWFKWREESLRRGSLVKLPECCTSEKNTLVLMDTKSTIRISYLNPGELHIDKSRDKTRNTNSWQANSGFCCACNHKCEQPMSPPPPPLFKCQDPLKQILPPQLESDVVISESNSKPTLEEFCEFLRHISPISAGDWQEAHLLGKLILILRAPLLFVTILTVPVVNREKRNNNWNRLLNSLHCVTIPVAVVLLLGLTNFGFDGDDGNDNDGDSALGNVEDFRDILPIVDVELVSRNDSSSSSSSSSQLVVAEVRGQIERSANMMALKCLLLSPAIALGLFVLFTTRAQKAPRLQAIYSYFGFAMSVMWIYVLANEIISVLKTVGIIFSMTDTAIGLGVLAWGNSLGDIVANLTLAEAGYARMALGASIGAPLLNLLLGFGLAFCVSLKPGESVQIEYSHTTALLAITLTLVLILLMLSTLISGSRSKKPLGYLLISCYGVYFALAVCFECDLIKF